MIPLKALVSNNPTPPAAAPWYAQRLPLAMKLRRMIRPILFHVWRMWQRAANLSAAQVKIEELVLQTHPRVFHPGQHFSSKILARHVAALPLRGCRVLDMGTGSGVIGIVAARHGAHVLAADINAHAIALARSNAALNGGTLQALPSDLFAALAPSEKFEWIIFNPPFFAKPAPEELHAAYNAGAQLETLARFFEEAPSHLAPDGKILLIVSSDMALDEMTRMLARYEYQLAQVEAVPHWFEIFYFVQLLKRELI